MKVVIVGDGKVGNTLVGLLASEGHDVTVIDNSSTALARTINNIDVNCMEGNGVSYAVQMEAGVQKADLLIAAASSDEINMLCCMIAKKLGCKHTIARVRNPEYQQQMFFLRDELGLSMTVNPEQAAAMEISRVLRFVPAIKVEPFARGRVELVEFRVREGSSLGGLVIHDFHRKYKVRVLICVMQRNDEVFIPDGNTVIEEGDHLSIVAAPQDITSFFKAIGRIPRKIKDVFIVGGGRIGYYLACQLIASGMHVKIIEKNEARCHELCNLLPKARILHGDGTNHELLHEEGLVGIDAFVALTGIDEENIILSMYANACHVEKVVTKVNNIRLLDMLATSGLESFISPKQIVAMSIMSYVRSMQNATGSNVETMYRIAEGRAEVMEFHVRRGAKCAGIPLKDLKRKPNILIAAIIRGRQCIIPDGNDMIEVRDSVIIATTLHGLTELDHIMQE